MPYLVKTNKHLLEEQDKKFPNRHREIHKSCCKKCPSNNDKKSGHVDLEVENYKTLPKETLARELVFVCAWRPNKLCKGICEDYGITQEYLNTLTKHDNNNSSNR